MQLRSFTRVASPTLIIILITALLAGGVFVDSPPSQAAPGDETTYYLLTDHLGSVDVVLDDAGNVVERRDFLPYGQERLTDSTTTVTKTDHKFTGKELDDETGLYYYGARYYDPLIGRFVSVDPLVLDQASYSDTKLTDILDNPQLLNAYSYAANNPVNTVDLTGEESQKALVTAAIAGLAMTYKYAERAGNGMGFIFEIYVTEDYEQAMDYAEAYDQNSEELASITYISAKKIANDVIPFAGTLLGSVVEEDVFMEDFSLEDSVLNSENSDRAENIMNNNKNSEHEEEPDEQ